MNQKLNGKRFAGQQGNVALLCVYLGIFLITILTAPSIPLASKSSETAKLITVRVDAGEFWGSGVLIAQQDRFYRVLTNAHVLSKDITKYPIHTHDGKVYEGVVIASAQEFKGDDLALLQFQSQKGIKYKLAQLGKTPPAGSEVLASGFPSPQLGEKNPGWVFNQGVVWQLLQKPLQGGYQLGYTNTIKKGMSGGPLLNQAGEVVAINGMHAYPLLGRPYIYKDRTIPSEIIIEHMARHSWGIPMEKIVIPEN